MTTTHIKPPQQMETEIVRFITSNAKRLRLPLQISTLETADQQQILAGLEVEVRHREVALSRQLEEAMVALADIQALRAIGDRPIRADVEPANLVSFLEDTIDGSHIHTPSERVTLSCRESVFADIDVRLFRSAVHGLLRHAESLVPDAPTIRITAYQAPALAIITLLCFGPLANNIAQEQAGDQSVLREDEIPDDDLWFQVARLLVDSHQGTLWRDRSIRHGVKFLVTLPSTDSRPFLGS